MNSDIERWKSFDINGDDFSYCDILHRRLTSSMMVLIERPIGSLSEGRNGFPVDPLKVGG
jgi:hypothetical protein